MPKSSTVTPERASQRGRKMRGEVILRPIDQIPQPPGGGGVTATGAWAYYLRRDGATITDILVLYPNGGVPDIDDRRLASRYGENAEYYRGRQRRRGLEYVGQNLTEESMGRLVEIMDANREDERLFLEEEIADAKSLADNSDLPEVRSQQRRRQAALTRRLEMLLAPFDPNALLAELRDIARAQQLAKVDPNILRVMRSMIGEVNDKMAEQIAHFQERMGSGGDRGADFEGKGHIEL